MQQKIIYAQGVNIAVSQEGEREEGDDFQAITTILNWFLS